MIREKKRLDDTMTIEISGPDLRRLDLLSATFGITRCEVLDYLIQMTAHGTRLPLADLSLDEKKEVMLNEIVKTGPSILQEVRVRHASEQLGTLAPPARTDDEKN